jgi:putative transcription factor
MCRRRGETVTTEQKYGAATNKHGATSLNTAKLDRETEELKHDRISMDVGKLIQKGRNAKVNTNPSLGQKQPIALL